MARAFNSRKRLYDALQRASTLKYLEDTFDLEYMHFPRCASLSLSIEHFDVIKKAVELQKLWILVYMTEDEDIEVSQGVFSKLDTQFKEVVLYLADTLTNYSFNESTESVITPRILNFAFSDIRKVILAAEFPNRTEEWLDYTESGAAVVVYKDDLSCYFQKGSSLREYLADSYYTDSMIATLVQYTDSGFALVEGKNKGKIVRFLSSGILSYFPTKYEFIQKDKVRARPFEGPQRGQIFAVKGYSLYARDNYLVSEEPILDITKMFL